MTHIIGLIAQIRMDNPSMLKELPADADCDHLCQFLENADPPIFMDIDTFDMHLYFFIKDRDYGICMLLFKKIVGQIKGKLCNLRNLERLHDTITINIGKTFIISDSAIEFTEWFIDNYMPSIKINQSNLTFISVLIPVLKRNNCQIEELHYKYGGPPESVFDALEDNYTVRKIKIKPHEQSLIKMLKMLEKNEGIQEVELDDASLFVPHADKPYMVEYVSQLLKKNDTVKKLYFSSGIFKDEIEELFSKCVIKKKRAKGTGGTEGTDGGE